ncbi:MAG TPA: hypothetical protein VM263_07855 [Acidimicrobiales bacterium]|nr:hypothetical protein [Acidimicrobiales bacterium]
MIAPDDPYRPVPQTVYWVRTDVLPAADPETYRVAVVLACPATPAGTVPVVTRSASDPFGVAHGPDRRLGLTSEGRFSRRLPVPALLWSPATAAPLGRLDDATFAAVTARFGA